MCTDTYGCFSLGPDCCRKDTHTSTVVEPQHQHLISTTDVAERSIHSNGGNAGWWRPGADALLFGAGHKNVPLSIGFNELSRTNRKTCSMAQDELFLVWSGVLVLLCLVNINSSNMLSGHIYEFPEMQSVRQYWILQLELK